MKRIGLTQPPSMQRAEARLGDRGAAVARPAARDDEEVGRPRYQVIRFQTIAPSSAPRITFGIHHRRLDQPLADRLGDRRADHERGRRS